MKESPSAEATVELTDPAVEHTGQQHLRGHMGVVGLVLTVLAFNAPLAVMAGFVPLVIGHGNQLGAPSTFALIGVLLLLFSVGLTTMSRFMKTPGAFYCYIAAGLGRAPGLGGAFIALSAYIAIAAGSYAYGGIVVEALVHGLLGGPSLPWWAWALALWVVASVLTLFNIDLSARVLGVAMCAEVAVVVVWTIAVGVDGGPEGRTLDSFTPSAFTSGSMAFALLFGVLCITGFEAVAVFREETRDPIKTVPRATYAAVGFLAVLYGFGAWAYIVAFGPSAAPGTAAEDPSGSFTASVGQYVGTIAVDVVTVLLVTSAFAAILATQNIAARYLYTLGRDSVLHPSLGTVHPTQGSPHIAASVVSLLCLVIVGIPALTSIDPVVLYALLTGFGGFCLLLLMTVTSVAVIAFFRKEDHSASTWRAVIAPTLSFLGLASILVLAASNLDAVIGGSKLAGRLALLLVVTIAGSGVMLALRYRRTKPDIFARIGRQEL